MDNTAIIAVLAGLIGARLVYVLVVGAGMSFLQMLEVWKGGLSSHGGYIFGILAGFAYLKMKKAGVARYADAVIPYMLLGWAIGRVGCFLNWDSFGKVTAVPWAVVVYGESRHTTQLYESFGYLFAFGIVKYLSSLPHPTLYNRRGGSIAALSLGLFALVRFIVDFWRDDAPQYILMSRIVTITVMVLAVVYIAIAAKKSKNVI